MNNKPSYQCDEIATKYLKHRPKYSKEIAEFVMSFCNKQAGDTPFQRDLMVDVGCGSGQSANIFQPYFKQILGIDVSREQLTKAKQQNKFDNIKYQEGSAEAIPVEDHSVDLVVVGIAIHFFDLPSFFDEVKRVLKPETGCLVILGYNLPTLRLKTQNSKPNKALESKSFELMKDVVKRCVERINRPMITHSFRFVYSRYDDIFEAIPFGSKLRDDSFHLRYSTSIADVCKYLSSFDAYHFYMEEEITKLKENNQEITEDVSAHVDPLRQLGNDLLELWDLPSDSLHDRNLEADFSLFILLANNKTE